MLHFENFTHRVRRKAGWRHPVEAAVFDTVNQPLTEALPRMRDLTRGLTPPVPGIRRFVSNRLTTSAREYKFWCEQAAWSWAASQAVILRLRNGRSAEVESLVDLPDETLLDSIRGGGLLVGGHVGVEGVIRQILVHRLPNFRALIGNKKDSILETGEHALGTAFERRKSLLNMALYIRKGGTVYAAVDGRQGSSVTEVPILGKKVQLRNGLVHLAKFTGGSALPIAALWSTDNRIRLVSYDPLYLSDVKSHPDQVERRWLNDWANWFENIIVNDPENARLDGGLWHTRKGGLLA